MRASASLAALALLLLAAMPAQGESLVPIVVLTVAPDEQFVNVTADPVEASFDCTVFVEGLPMVRYRVNLTALCEGWATRCDPALFVVTGMANNSFRAYVTVPAGTSSTMQHQVEIIANVSSTGIPLASLSAYALVSVWPVYGLKLGTGIQRVSVDAGDEVTWPFTLQNTGNGRDSFTITTINPSSFPGWTVKCNRTTVNLDTNSSINLNYTIRPPADARNQTQILQFRVYSKYAFAKNLSIEQKLELEIAVNAVAQPANVTEPGEDKEFLPGAQAVGLALALALAAAVAWRRRK